MESKDRPPEPLVSGTILTDGPSGPTQQDLNSTTRKRWDYDTAEVDAFQQEIRDTFLGIKQPRSHRMRPTTSGSGWPGGVVTTWCRLTPSVMKPNRSWRRCGPTYRGRRD